MPSSSSPLSAMALSDIAALQPQHTWLESRAPAETAQRRVIRQLLLPHAKGESMELFCYTEHDKYLIFLSGTAPLAKAMGC